MSQIRVLIAGAGGGSNIGGSLWRGAQHVGIEAVLCDSNEAWSIGTIRQSLAWRLRGRRPLRFRTFNKRVMQACSEFRPAIVLVTGRAGVAKGTLRSCREAGIRTVNFLTDDPFNPRMHSPWFMKTLCLYDVLFTPRRSNIADLRAYGCANVEYLRFGYDPELFYRSSCNRNDEKSDLFFAGHVEDNRFSYISAAIKEGFDLRLHGKGWERYAVTRPNSRGEADIATIREEARQCKVALCLVRHENRDGHSMRTFELPATGACMLVEDTEEHREIFGNDGDRVAYFSSPTEMIGKTKSLLRAPAERTRMRNAVYNWIVNGQNTYADRLREILLEVTSTTNP